MTVIEIKETKQWSDANLLKASIKWMLQRNDGRFDKAIADEEAMLEAFFRQFRAKGEPTSLSQAA